MTNSSIMRDLMFIVFFFLIAFGKAQTVISVQSGPWTSASTWDCDCVPDLSQNIVIMHSVGIDSPLLMGHQQVQVTSAGEITMSFPASVSLNTVLINEGHVLFIGDILNGGLFNNAGFAEFVGTLLNDGSIISDAGALLQVEGDFTNQDLVQGEGAICVTDLTDNQGAISGTLDFCDWTPTATEPPFLDQNSGAVESGITFCQNTPCASAIGKTFGADMEIFPALTDGQVVLSGVPSGATILVIDALGRPIAPSRTVLADRITWELFGLPTGAYRVVISAPAGQRVLPFVIAR